MSDDEPVGFHHLPDPATWLRERMPLVLLLDLAAQPDSAAILAAEPADTSWLPYPDEEEQAE